MLSLLCMHRLSCMKHGFDGKKSKNMINYVFNKRKRNKVLHSNPFSVPMLVVKVGDTSTDSPHFTTTRRRCCDKTNHTSSRMYENVENKWPRKWHQFAPSILPPGGSIPAYLNATHNQLGSVAIHPKRQRQADSPGLVLVVQDL